jgi:hypothetical protein
VLALSNARTRKKAIDFGASSADDLLKLLFKQSSGNYSLSGAVSIELGFIKRGWERKLSPRDQVDWGRSEINVN